MKYDGRERHSPFTEILNALWGENVVVPLPRELSLDESLGSQALEGLDDLEIGNIELFMLRRVEVFFSHQDTL
jgi:hypothetical protein